MLFVFSVNHSVDSILPLLFFSSHFVFVIDEEFEKALRKPTERTNNLPRIVAVLSVMRGVKELSISVLMTTVEAGGNVLLPY